MSELKPSPFTFSQFHIDEFSIKRDPVKEGKPIYRFTPSGYIDKTTSSFLLTMNFEVKDSNEAYDIKCKCVGFFKFKIKESDDIQLNSFFYLNAPAIIFPYIRSYIASVTALSGLSAVHLPLINFPKAVGEDLKANTFSSDDKIKESVN